MTPAEQHTPVPTLAALLETFRRNLRCRLCLDRGFHEIDYGEHGERRVECACGGGA